MMLMMYQIGYEKVVNLLQCFIFEPKCQWRNIENRKQKLSKTHSEELIVIAQCAPKRKKLKSFYDKLLKTE